MRTRFGNVIRRLGFEAVGLFLLGAALRVVFDGAVSPYPAFVEVPAGAVLTVWCLNSVLWHWQEFRPRERLTRLLVGGLAGPAFVVVGFAAVPDAPDRRLYVVTMAAGVLLAGVMEVFRAATGRRPPPEVR